MNSVTLISITGEDQPGLTGSLMSLMAEHGIQVLDIGQAVIHRSLALGSLVCFDMDSTLLEGEVIDELAVLAGVDSV